MEPFPYTLASMLMILWISIAVSILAVGFMTIGTLAVGSYVSSMYFYVRTVFIAALAILVLVKALRSTMSPARF